jgi:hypothetical protein
MIGPVRRKLPGTAIPRENVAVVSRGCHKWCATPRNAGEHPRTKSAGTQQNLCVSEQSRTPYSGLKIRTLSVRFRLGALGKAV